MFRFNTLLPVLIPQVQTYTPGVINHRLQLVRGSVATPKQSRIRCSKFRNTRVQYSLRQNRDNNPAYRRGVLNEVRERGTNTQGLGPD